MSLTLIARDAARVGTVAALAALAALAGCADPVVAPTHPAPVAARAAAVGPAHPGDIAFGSRRDGGPPEIWVMNADGSDPVQLTNSPGSVIINGQPDWTTNGRRIAFVSTRTGNREIFAMHADGSDPVALTQHPATDEAPVWSPNAKQIAFHSDRDGDFDIWLMNADGSGVTQLTNHPAVEQYPDWSPSGQQLAFQRGGDIHVLDLRTGVATQLTFTPELDDMPAWSPNGQQLAFMSRRDGYPAIHVVNADGSGQVNLTPRPAGVAPALWQNFWPSWSRDGKRIHFQSGRPETAGDIEIYVMNADGSAPRRLTAAPGIDSAPVAR